MIINSKYMDLALRIAFDNIGNTSPNPSVGAVIVKNNNVLSTGGTSEYGSDHAEVVSIKNAAEKGIDIRGAEMYVSLEPCDHHGNTPPCTEAIIKAGISKVYIPICDPNPIVCFKGTARLKNAGVDVEVLTDYSSAAGDLIRPFEKFIFHKKPFVISKSAMTLDGRIAAMSGDSKWISSVNLRYIAHRLRAKVDAVIVGKNTFLKDNPALNVRLCSFDNSVRDRFSSGDISLSGRKNFFLTGLLNFTIQSKRDPLRVIVGLPETVDPGSNVFNDNNYIIFAREKEYERYMKGGTFIPDLNIVKNTGTDPDGEIEFILTHLAGKGIMCALLEGGSALAGSFLDAGAIDQFIYIIVPMIAGNGLSPLNSRGHEKISESHHLHDITIALIDDEILYSGYSESKQG